jgi:FkbM family methyltransferase
MLDGMTRLLDEGRLRVLFLSTHGHAISGDHQTHEKCLAWLKAKGAHIIAEHSVAGSYSGDGLIVASFDSALRFEVEISHRPIVPGTGDTASGETGPAAGQTAAADEARFVSYAQNGEDVLLWRALGSIQNGFYIDVGAYDPLKDSVTQAFYERGWHGINVEPVPSNASSFVRTRARDLTLMVAASNENGSRQFYEVEGSGLSSFDDRDLHLHRQAGWTVREHTVPTFTLAEICRLHAAPVIHFLKIDAEESELQVLEGADLTTFRPWIILVESVLPNSSQASHMAWESILFEAGYEFLFFDGLNRYYASREKAEAMRPHFNRPANPLDHFVTYREKCLEDKLASLFLTPPKTGGPSKAVTQLRQQVTELKAAVKQLETKLRYHAVNPARALKLWWDRPRP